MLPVEPAKQVSCLVQSICGALFRINCTLWRSWWSVSVNMTQCDPSHPSYSSGDSLSPVHGSMGQAWGAFSHSHVEEKTLRCFLHLFFSPYMINTLLSGLEVIIGLFCPTHNHCYIYSCFVTPHAKKKKKASLASVDEKKKTVKSPQLTQTTGDTKEHVTCGTTNLLEQRSGFLCYICFNKRSF